MRINNHVVSSGRGGDDLTIDGCIEAHPGMTELHVAKPANSSKQRKRTPARKVFKVSVFDAPQADHLCLKYKYVLCAGILEGYLALLEGSPSSDVMKCNLCVKFSEFLSHAQGGTSPFRTTGCTRLRRCTFECSRA